MKRLPLLAATLCAAFPLIPAFSQAPAAKPAPVRQPKLVLVIVADQFRYDYLTRFRAHYTSGLKRLLDQGAVFTNAHYEHFPTVTAVGHSVILSGALPSASGIVGNEWYDRAARKQVTSVSDESVKTLGAPSRTGASPRQLLVSTIGDELKMSGKAPAKVIGLSIKDRSGILPAGRMADGAYWFDTETGNLVSSTYYFPDLPAWVKSFNEKKSIDQWAGKDWAPYSGGKVFTTLPAQPGKSYYDRLTATRYGNDIVAMFAEAAIEGENLGRNGGTDLLSMSFSSNDTVGHAKGPDSPEVMDISIHTDRLIGRLLDYLDKRLGLANVLVVFTADHGVGPMPEVLKQRNMNGGRIPETEVLEAANRALEAKYGSGRWVLGKSGPSAYLDHELIRSKGLDLEEVQQTAAQAIRMIPHITRVYIREELKRGLAQNDLVGRRVQNGFFYQRASDVFIVSEPYWIFENSGASHGTPWNYDSHVPVIFMGPAVKPGTYHQRVGVVDIAPTLATILSVETPSGSSGRPLDEILRK